MSLDFDWVDGGGGGSGGQTIQYNVMPTPAVSGKIIQYVGETGANYTQGYFYQGVGGGSGSATISQTSGSGITNLAVNVSTFESGMPSVIGSALTTGNYAFEYDGMNWNYGQSSVNMASVGITFTEPEASIGLTIVPAEGESIMGASLEDQSLWESAVSESGTYTFTYNLQIGDFTLDGTTPADLHNEYGIDVEVGYAKPPVATGEQTVGSGLTVNVYDPVQFAGISGYGDGDYTFVFDGDNWKFTQWNEEEIPYEDIITLEEWGIEVIGTPTSGDTFVVNLTAGFYGPVDGDQIIVDYTTGLNSGDEITVVYTDGLATWQQINVQPTPEISTQTTVGGNTELSADTGVLVVDTPDGTENKQVANVQYVDNIVGNIETILSNI